MAQKQTKTKNEKELRRLAGIAVRQLNFRSLRDYELEMYRKAIEQANKKSPQAQAA